jgi:hypothetical protein
MEPSNEKEPGTTALLENLYKKGRIKFLSFDRTDHNPFDKVFLQEGIHEQNGYGRYHDGNGLNGLLGNPHGIHRIYGGKVIIIPHTKQIP